MSASFASPAPDIDVGAHHETTRQTAVREADEVLAAQWPVWADAHDLRPRPVLQRAAPRVTVVGECAESLHEVATVAFTFRHAGREYRGFARGPASAPTFVVSRQIAVDPQPARHRLRAFRRRAA